MPWAWGIFLRDVWALFYDVKQCAGASQNPFHMRTVGERVSARVAQVYSVAWQVDRQRGLENLVDEEEF